MTVPISTGTGAASVAAEAVGGNQYQQIEVLGQGGASTLGVNPDGSFNASIIGKPTIIVGGGSVLSVSTGSVISVPTGSIITVWQSSSVIAIGSGSILSVPTGSVITVWKDSSVFSYQAGTQITSLVSTIPSSVMVGASIFGQLPAGTAPLGSVATLQGTVPWIISSVYGNISGSVVAFQGAGWSGSVAAINTGTQSSSVYGMRNDALASFLGADLTERPVATDSAGRVLNKPFSAEESRIEGYITLTSTSVTTLVAAAGAGLRNYITDFFAANTDGTNGTLITMKDGAGSILGYTIAPSKGGSNLPGMLTPIRTGANATFDVQAGTAASTLYVTVKGFKGP